MSSSDSEDGYYSNAAKKMRLAREQLKKLQSTDVDENKFVGKTKEVKSKVNLVSNSVPSLNDSFDDSLIIDEIIANNSKPTPKTRGRKKKESIPSETSIEPVTNSRSRGRGRGVKRSRGSKNDTTQSDQNDTSLEILNNGGRRRAAIKSLNKIEALSSATRGRGGKTGRGGKRGRGGQKGRGSRSRTSFSPNSSIEEIMQNFLPHFNGTRGLQRNGEPNSAILNTPSIQVIPTHVNQIYPTYSVGNTDEYPDKSDDVPLFNKPLNTKQDDIIIVEDELSDNLDDEPLSVKVTWRSLEIFKFTICKYQKLTQIFETFSKKENVSQDKLLFTYNNKILTQNDTPASIDYNIAKFIDGGVVSHSIKAINKVKIVNGVKIKFQCQNLKKPIEITIGSDDTISSAMTECAEHLKVPLDKLKFEFDGDIVAGTNTPQHMGLENGDCIDVKIIN